jgi:hypothetical protein
MIRATQLSLFLAGISLLALPLSADENPSRKPANPAAGGKPATAKANPAEVKTLVEQLKSGKYKERNDATNKLMAAGGAAIGPVAKAAMTDDLELGARCVDILKHSLQNGDAASKAAAQKALLELRNSKHASVAKWAGEALQQRAIGAFPNGVRNRNFNRRGRIGGMRGGIGFQREVTAVDNGKTIHIKETILPGNRQIVVKVTEKVNGKDKTTEYKATTSADLRIKHKPIYDLYARHIGKAQLMIVGPNNAAIPVQAPGANIGFGARVGGARVISHTVNGQRTTTIREAGGRRIVLQDNNGKDIEVTITETANGKHQTTQVKAKDLAELKKKNAEAGRIYEKYDNLGRNALRGAINPFGRFGGGAFPAPRVVPAVPLQQARRNSRIDSRKEIEKAKVRLQATIDKLRKLAAAGKADPKDLRQVADELKAARQELEKATRNLEP